MLRKTAYVILVLIVIGALGYGIRFGLEWHQNRPVSGGLNFIADETPSAKYQIGNFIVSWDTSNGGRMYVTHQDEPDRELWSSVPGRGFVAAGKGRETVKESRGHFYISDDLEIYCALQSIDRIEQQENRLVVRGRICGDRETGYRLVFRAVHERQLSFDLILDGPLANRAFFTYASDPDERFFGFGVQYSRFDMKGRFLPIFVSEQGVGRGLQPVTAGADLTAGAGGKWHSTYACVPHYISSRMRSLFFENYDYVAFDLRRDDQVQVRMFAPTIRGRILYGRNPTELIAEYTKYAGRMRPLPDWVHKGAIVGMQGGTDRVREVYQMLKAHQTPLAGFWLQDWVGNRTTSFGRQLWWNWVLDRNQYPDWEDLIADLEKDGVRVLSYVNPSLVDIAKHGKPGRNLFQEAQQNDFLVKRLDGQPYRIQNSDFFAGLLDLTNPEAGEWFKKVLREEVIRTGVYGWMADYAEGLPYDARLFSGATGAEYHNKYPEDWARLNREVLNSLPNGNEFVFFTRSGFRRSPTYSTLFFLGDQLVSWDRYDGIKTAVTGMLSGGMSGFSLNHSDIGGFTTITHFLKNYHRSRELLWRWMEMNAFTAVFRSHEGVQPQHNHQVYSDDQTMAHFSRMARVYLALAEYRKELVREAAETGLPVVRHLFIHYPDDPKVYNLSFEEFMLGPDFLIAPVLDKGAEKVQAYLPAGKWVHLWTGQEFGQDEKGTRITVAAPFGQPGVFYKKGSKAAESVIREMAHLGIRAGAK
jgi:alpha-glucosidase